MDTCIHRNDRVMYIRTVLTHTHTHTHCVCISFCRSVFYVSITCIKIQNDLSVPDLESKQVIIWDSLPPPPPASHKHYAPTTCTTVFWSNAKPYFSRIGLNTAATVWLGLARTQRYRLWGRSSRNTHSLSRIICLDAKEERSRDISRG